MKTKLTLSINKDVVERAKRTAKAEGRSLSSVVEEQLATYQTENPAETFIKEWQGVVPVPEKDPDDPRLNYLIDKYIR